MGPQRCLDPPLKLGALWTDGVVGPQPPIHRGLHTVVDAVRKAGHKVMSWKPPTQSTAKRVHVSFLKADGAHDIHAQLDLSWEPLISDLQKAFPEATDGFAGNTTANEDGQIVDAVIMPVALHAAVIPGKFYYTAYTEAMDLTNYSIVVIPVTKADKNIDVDEEEKIWAVAKIVCAALEMARPSTRER
ncbi:MAG: hypothetical protein FRX48_02400 [Lasallia pustulata]|uniref:Uncharacterized protein n=1 Tax=Lasallia pustulata TaxID=136370 RepID=A0A5M8PZD8_9LECA|nr:MAG: hypothetical protein FRX48_02400 [Lasallia pustulata]